MERVRGKTAGLETLARIIAVPHDHQPTRLPSFPNLERTATMRFMGTATITASTVPQDMFLMRQPAFPLWITTALNPVVAADSCSIYTLFDSGYDQFQTGGESLEFPDQTLSGVASAGTKAITDKFRLPVGSCDGRLFAFVGTENVVISLPLVAFTGTSAAFQLHYEYWDHGVIGLGTVSFLGQAGLVGVTVVNLCLGANNYAWIRPVRLVCTTAPSVVMGFSGAVYVGVTTTSITPGAAVYGGTNFLTAPAAHGTSVIRAVLPWSAPPEFTVSTLPYRSTRVTACAVLVSNVTAVLAKEGTVEAARVPIGQAINIWARGSAISDILSEAHVHERYFGALEKGLYAYSAPDAASAVFSTAYETGSGITPVLPVVRLDQIDYVSLLRLSDLAATNGDSTFAVTLDTHLEFRSSSMLFPLGYSAVPLESYHAAQLALANLGTFFENPTHLAAITRLVSGAVRTIAPIVMPHVQAAAVSLGKAAFNKLLSSRPRPAAMQQAGFTTVKPKLVVKPRPKQVQRRKPKKK